jgi:hypothetical protein
MNHCNEGPLCPQPEPPWLRPIQSPFVQVLTGNGNIDLGPQITTFQQGTAQADGNPYVIALPNGNYQGQTKTVIIPGINAPSTAPAFITGVFTGTISYLLNSAATMAVFLWDGSAWALAGGNAQPSSTAPTP